MSRSDWPLFWWDQKKLALPLDWGLSALKPADFMSNKKLALCIKYGYSMSYKKTICTYHARTNENIPITDGKDEPPRPEIEA